jgi:hypothetical protein
VTGPGPGQRYPDSWLGGLFARRRQDCFYREGSGFCSASQDLVSKPVYHNGTEEASDVVIR